MTKDALLKITPKFSVDEEPFTGDSFNRSDFSKRINSIVDRLKSGVIAIDAPWGEGKTWFADHWYRSIKNERKVIYFDAFKNDYIDDPFILITSELTKEILDDQDTKDKIIEKAATVSKIIIPTATKILINTLGRIVFGTIDLSNDAKKIIEEINKEASEATENYLKNSFKDYEKEQKSLEEFTTALSDFTEKQDKPVLIFIDELDRCKPTFAVQLIERIKHFFDVPNLVFVLFVNREQLEKSIKGIYGSEIDASGYLRKFIDIPVDLPKINFLNPHRDEYLVKYIETLFASFDYSPKNDRRLATREFLVFLTHALKLSLRDIERIFSIMCINQNMHNLLYLKIWLIILMIKENDTFQLIRNNSKKGHEQARDICDKILDVDLNSSNTMRDVIVSLKRFHEWHITGKNKNSLENEDFLREIKEVTRGYDKWTIHDYADEFFNMAIQEIFV